MASEESRDPKKKKRISLTFKLNLKKLPSMNVVYLHLVCRGRSFSRVLWETLESFHKIIPHNISNTKIARYIVFTRNRQCLSNCGRIVSSYTNPKRLVLKIKSMSRWGRSKEATDARKSTIGDLPTDIKQRILEYMPIQVAARTSILSKRWTHIWSTQPNLVFDRHFFQYVSNKGASAARIIHKILMQHAGPILGFQLISREHKLAQSDVDQCITFLLENGVQKLTIDTANNKPYALPYAIFTSSTLTHLKLSRCIFELPDVINLPNLVSLNLELVELASRKTLRFPHLSMLEILKINMSRIRSYTEIFSFYHVAPMLRSIKHLYLAGSFLKNSWMVPEPEKLVQPLNLESLILYDLEISYKHIYCALCFLRISPKLYELDIRQTVRVGDTPSNTTELLSNYFSEPRNLVNEALKMIKTVRLRKFKGSRVEMCLVRLLLAHSLNLEKMIIEQYMGNSTRCNEHLKELVSFPRASPKAVLKYIDSPSHETRKRAAPV